MGILSYVSNDIKSNPYGNLQALAGTVVAVAAIVALKWPIAAFWLGCMLLAVIVNWVFTGKIEFGIFTDPIIRVVTGISIIAVLTVAIFKLIESGHLDPVLLPLLEALGF